MAHWVTNAGRSAQVVVYWNKPCQCCRRRAVSQSGCQRRSCPRRIRTMLVGITSVAICSWSITLMRKLSPCQV